LSFCSFMAVTAAVLYRFAPLSVKETSIISSSLARKHKSFWNNKRTLFI